MLRRIVSFALVAALFLALAAPAFAGRAHGGAFHGGGFRGSGFRGGFHGSFHHHHGFHRFGCCFGPAIVGGVFLGAVLAAPYYAYPYPYPYPLYAPPPAYQAPVYAAPSVTREVCYTGGCYHLQGDGVTVPYRWVWEPAVPTAPPPGPPKG
jgi:hypothetical protein